MGHLKERKAKNCLNCNAQVYGRFCHICGQENTETKETFWHLVTHFFNDITHFDGKFFTTLKLLVFRPGFLSGEYVRGRRVSYLNPVRMYIFTSFVFFLVFFSVFTVESQKFQKKINNRSLDEISAMDSTAFSNFTMKLNEGKPMTRDGFEEYVKRQSKVKLFGGTDYESKEAYDEALRSGKVKHNWFSRKINYKNIELNDKMRENEGGVMQHFLEIWIHYFPQMLFISLPLFALFLKWIYFRNKTLVYASHGIYAIHLYIFYFIALLLLTLLNTVEKYSGWEWLNLIYLFTMLYVLYYEYRAMRNFYQQSRWKTVLRFLTALTSRFVLIVILMVTFLFLSIFKI